MEIIVVIVIISLMMGFAVPRLDSFLSEDRSKKGVRLLAAMVSDLKRKSVKTGQDYLLVINPLDNKVWVETQDPKNAQKRSLGEDINIKGVNFGSDRFISGSKVYIGFFKKGYNDPFSVVLQNRTSQKIYTMVFHPFLSSPDIYDRLYLSD